MSFGLPRVHRFSLYNATRLSLYMYVCAFNYLPRLGSSLYSLDDEMTAVQFHIIITYISPGTYSTLHIHTHLHTHAYKTYTSHTHTHSHIHSVPYNYDTIPYHTTYPFHTFPSSAGVYITTRAPFRTRVSLFAIVMYIPVYGYAHHIYICMLGEGGPASQYVCM